jgi:hypothetical protein
VNSNYLSTQLKQNLSRRGFKIESKNARRLNNTKVKMLTFKGSFVVEFNSGLKCRHEVTSRMLHG